MIPGFQNCIKSKGNVSRRLSWFVPTPVATLPCDFPAGRFSVAVLCLCVGCLYVAFVLSLFVPFFILMSCGAVYVSLQWRWRGLKAVLRD